MFQRSPNSLGAYGQDPNEIMKHVKPDIMQSSTVGFNTTDALDRNVRLLLDLIAAFGDFPTFTSQGDLA